MDDTVLHHVVVAAEGSRPKTAALFLHGVFGSGQNFRTVARGIVSAVVDLELVLVDLRGHGASPSLPGPHTLEAAARDVCAVEQSLALPVTMVIGHSFGGKVALAFADARAMAGRPLEHVIVLDSSPAVRADGMTRETAGRVLALLEGMPKRLDSRGELVDRVVASGYPKAVGQWLAMNLSRDPSDDRYTLSLDLPAIRDLLNDYFSTDMLPLVERLSAQTRFDFLLAERGSVVTPDVRSALDGLAARQVDHATGVSVAVLEGAGHTVHADAPEATRAAIVDAIAARRGDRLQP